MMEGIRISVVAHLAIKLAVSELKKLPEAYLIDWEAIEGESRKIIKNLLTGLGCEAMVEAWNECT